MGAFSHWHWLIVLIVVVLILVLPRRNDQSGKPLDAAGHPVFSSVSLQGEEAEHIDQKLPKRWGRLAAYTVSLIVLAAALWHISRPPD
jgi:hypothetical protein